MTMLVAHNLAQSFGHFNIFQDISVQIEKGHRIGLVGPNGVGKTSLLHILAGLEKPSRGGVGRAKDVSIGYLHQEAVRTFANRDHTVRQEMFTVFDSLRLLEQNLRVLEESMSKGSVTDRVYAEYSDRLEEFELQGGYEYETRIERTTRNLGFGEEELDMPLAHLSGGQKTRALLARLLLEEPDLLMLDEPTNHLDLEAIEWLESTLTQWEGTLLIVSHDRHFLNQVVNTIWEMSPSAIDVYRGDYSAYTQQRAERWARRQKEFDADKKRLTKEMAFIHKHIGSGRGRNIAYGKLRRVSDELETEGRAIKVSRAQEKVKALRRPSGDWQRMRINLTPAPRSGKIVLRARNLTIGYDKPLFEATNVKLLRGERAALLGPNGSGKTTFVRTICGQTGPLAGSLELGVNLKLGYFAQAHDNLDPTRSALDELMFHQPEGHEPRLDHNGARHLLARYLFQGDDVFKPVNELSGGERGRLALAILASQGANFLLLDEPTNHLDIPAQEVLQQVLEDFNGTLLMISHDRYLVNRLATQVWRIKEGMLHVQK